MGDMTERPQSFIGKPVIVPGLFFPGKPHAADLIAGMRRRHSDMVPFVHHFSVRWSIPMRDPYAGAGTHYRFERRHESARRYLHDDVPIFPIVGIGLSVGHYQHLIAGELLVKNRLEAGRGPRYLALIAHAA